MRTYVVGTAGHVDHGKSTLVKSLTGIDPDRLREEKERQLTIDLGFAWMTLPGGINVGIVDVPGHRDFIENMLAGVGGINAALFVVAADEGMMPQSREHLEILDLLEVSRGVIALTKIDLVQDDAWLDLVEEEVRGFFSDTSLASAPFFRVSSRNGMGLEELAEGLAAILTKTKRAADKGRARMPVDRVFTLKGYGTIVTGTLIDGHLEAGQQIFIMPQRLEGRVRGLQTHKQDVNVAVPGSRVAVNISGVNVDNIQRGDVLVADISDQPTTLIDAKVRVLESSTTSIVHNQEVKLFAGADQKIARVRLLGQTDQLFPGDSGWIQLMVREPLVVRRGDRFVLRRPSPPLTLGGGRIVDPQPAHRYRLSNKSIIAGLERRLDGGQGQVIVSALEQLGPANSDVIARKVNLEATEVREQLVDLAEDGRVVTLEAGGKRISYFLLSDQFEQLSKTVARELSEYHESYPLRIGISAEELRNKLDLSPEVFSALLERLLDSRLVDKQGPWLRLSEFEPSLNEVERSKVENVLDHFQQSPYAPPSIKDCRESLGDDVYSFLIGQGMLIEVSDDVVFREEDYLEMVKEVKELIRSQNAVTVAEARDHFSTSRKYILAFLEHLDQRGVTVREGDHRRLPGELLKLPDAPFSIDAHTFRP